MPHIDLPEDVPGILGPMKTYPNTAGPMLELAEEALRGPSPLSEGERELIAAYTSSRNECTFCTRSHSSTAEKLLEDEELVDQVKADYESAPISEKMKALLAISEKVQGDARDVSDEEISRAREAGATDKAIHDTVLITAAFCMYNRYVDGLATWTPEDEDLYDEHGKQLAEQGYNRMEL